MRFPPGGEPLPVPDGAGEVAAGEGARYETVESDGTSVRVLVAPFVPGYAVEVGRPLDEVESTLDDLRRTIIHAHARRGERGARARAPALRIHALIFLSSIIVWMPLLSPLPEVPRLPPLGRMLFLFLQSIVPTIPASFLTFGAHPLYSYYAKVPRLWGSPRYRTCRSQGSS